MIFSEQALWLVLNMVLFGESMAGLMMARTTLDSVLLGAATALASAGAVISLMRMIHVA